MKEQIMHRHSQVHNESKPFWSCGRVCIAMNAITQHSNNVLLSLKRITIANGYVWVMRETRKAVEQLVDGLKEIAGTQYNQVLFMEPIRKKENLFAGLSRLDIFHVQQALNVFQWLYSAESENQMEEYVELPLSIHGVEIACVIAPRELEGTLFLWISAIQGHLESILSKVENRELWILSQTDYLTWLLSRWALDERWSEIISIEEQATILFIDIDHFKRVNDSYGHAIGDEILRKVSEQIRSAFGEYICGRYGGEEFVVIIPGVEKNIVIQMAEDFRWSVAQDLFHLDDSTIETHVSIGIAHKIPNEQMDYEKLRKNADKALYHAKKLGRNRVIAFERT